MSTERMVKSSEKVSEMTTALYSQKRDLKMRKEHHEDNIVFPRRVVRAGGALHEVRANRNKEDGCQNGKDSNENDVRLVHQDTIGCL